LYFEKKLEEFSLIKDLKDISYYERVKELFSFWGKKNLFCAKISSHSFYYLALMTMNESDYNSALSFDEEYYQFCFNQGKLSYYNENTMKREIYDNLGMIHLKKENYKLAMKYFKRCQNHLKLKVVFKKMVKKEPENINLLKKIGDYYAKIGMSEAANDKYRDVISMTMDKDVVAEMYERIANSEEKRKNLPKDCMEKKRNLIEKKAFI